MTDLLKKFKELNIKVYLTPEGKIRLKGDEEVLTPELIEEVKQYKQELIELLRPVSFLEIEQWIKEGRDVYQEAKRRGFSEWDSLNIWFWSKGLPDDYAKRVIQVILNPKENHHVSA